MRYVDRLAPGRRNEQVRQEQIRDARRFWEEMLSSKPLDTEGHIVLGTPRGVKACLRRDRREHREHEHDQLENATMNMILEVTDYEQGPAIPEDDYVVALESFSEPKTGEFGDYVYVRVKVVGGDHDGNEVSSIASLKMGKGAKLRTWVEAFIGRPLNTGEKVDLAKLAAGHPKARAAVGMKYREDGSEINRLETIKRLPPQKAAAKPAAAVVTATDDGDDVPF